MLNNIKEITGNAIVTAVYQGPNEDSGEDNDDISDLMDINELFPGQVKINLKGRFNTGDDKSAWVIGPYSHHPMTVDPQSNNLEKFSNNQSFGFFAMPRVGDKVVVIATTRDDTSTIASVFYVIGSLFSTGAHRPQLTDNDDVQTVHRSGSSIRFNDTYGGGGSITADGTETDGFMGGLTGNTTLTGNRVMVMAGSKYLAHGLLAKYGDPRDLYTKAEIDAVSKSGTYDSLFSNTEEPDNYHNPFTSDLIGDKFFLAPPAQDDSKIPLTDNTLLMLQHGGGVMRIDDHDTEEGYSRMTMAAASMTTLIGKDYQPVGLAGDSSAPNDDASGIDEDVDEYAVHQVAGAKFKIYANGDMEVFSAPGRNITIKGADGEGNIYIGEGTDAVFRSGDETTTNKAQTSFCGVPESHMGTLGIPHTHTHNGHSHEGVERQSKTYA